MTNIDIDYPNTDQIEPELAKFLFEQHCAICIIENLPQGSEFGIDLATYRIGEKFKGIKLIPPGVHFIYASAAAEDSLQSGPRSGFFYNFKVKELLVKRWSISEEEFEEEYQPSEDELGRYRANLRDLDRYLGPYKFSTLETYLNLTDKMYPQLVETLLPNCKYIRSVPYLTRDDKIPLQPQRQRRDVYCPSSSQAPPPTLESLLPDLKPDRETVIHFTKIIDYHTESSQKIDANMVTQYNLDTTMKLNHTFKNYTERQHLLGELQFAFVTFLLCHHFDCFEQWKRILKLVCLADSGLMNYPQFFIDFTEILMVQFEQISEDLFDDIVDSNNLVRHLMDTFFQNVADCVAAPKELKHVTGRLKVNLENRFGWVFELERDDERPVIVEL